MKVAVVYTSTTPELIQMVDGQLREHLQGQEAEILSYKDPSILQEARDNGGVTSGCARRLIGLYEEAMRHGAGIILNVCSSVGDVAKLAKPLYEMMGVSFIRIDEDMAMAAVEAGARVGIIATLNTTLEPTKRLVKDCAREQGREVVLVDALAEGAFGLNQVQFKQMLIDTAMKIVGQVDVFLMAQGSMAYAEEDVARATGKPVFSSIRFGTAAVGRAAQKMNDAGRSPVHD